MLIPLKAAEPVRAMPYPIKTAAGLTKNARAEEFEAVKEARASAFPVVVVNQSTASLKRKGTCTFKTWKTKSKINR